MPAKFSTNVRGLEELQGFFKEFPRRYRGIAAEAVADDLIGTPMRGLKHYPPYKYVTRARAFGKAFVSDRQRRFVMGRIRDGRINPGYPHRTGRYQRSWKRVGSGVQSRIEGELPHDGWPNRLASRIGWHVPDDIIRSNEAHAGAAAERAVQREINARGYG